MRFIIFLTKFVLLFYSLLTYSSCDNPDIDCENGGISIDDKCECPPFYEGPFCTIDIVQNRLLTETPFELILNGVPEDSLYGKEYAGGLIFYLDVLDTLEDIQGIVVAKKDLEKLFQWGCKSIDIDEVPNVSPLAPGNSPGAAIGHGYSNTIGIINSGCAENSAAKACDTLILEGYDDWHLPSIKELELIHSRLHRKGIGNFKFEYYWSSTEDASFNAWGYNFKYDYSFSLNKFHNNELVRATRNFSFFDNFCGKQQL